MISFTLFDWLRVPSSIHQFEILPEFWPSLEQSYGRKLIISKSRIALTPLKTLEIALVIPSFKFTVSKSSVPSTLIEDQYFINTNVNYIRHEVRVSYTL